MPPADWLIDWFEADSFAIMIFCFFSVCVNRGNNFIISHIPEPTFAACKKKVLGDIFTLSYFLLHIQTKRKQIKIGLKGSRMIKAKGRHGQLFSFLHLHFFGNK